MATNKDILNAIQFVNRGMISDNTHYHSIHRSITQISGETHVIRNDIREISTYVSDAHSNRDGNGDNK